MVSINKSTQQFYKQRWDTFLAWLGDRPVSSGSINDYVNSLREKHYSISHINAFIVTASHNAPDYVVLPGKIKKDYEGRRKPPLTKSELEHFEKGISILNSSQQAGIYHLLRGEPTGLHYASIYFLVQRLGLLTLGRAVSPGQVKGLKAVES